MPYQAVRSEQSDGAKRLEQCSLTHTRGHQPVRRDDDDQHDGGRELGQDGTVNVGEPLLNVVMTTKPNVLIGLHQQVRGPAEQLRLLLSQTGAPPANRRDLPHPRIVCTRNVVTPCPSHSGTGTARCLDEGAGRGR